MVPPWIAADVPLAPKTSLELGGTARWFAEAASVERAIEALRFAGERGLASFVLGGGSNLVVGDEGFAGLVLRPGWRGLRVADEGGTVLLECQAGEPWDGVVAASVERGLAGLECLSGIPGLVGATPVQNVGAYGHEVSEALRSVRVLDRRTLQICDLSPRECRFAYRDSLFKREPDRWLVLAVTFALHPGPAEIRYPELARLVSGTVTPAQARAAVLELRRKKSMVLDREDANRRSAGSFFTNPVVAAARAEELVAQAIAEGLARSPEDVPRFALPDGRVKLAAGWLIERAGIERGLRMGAVGVSTRHALALVHHGGGTTAELLRLAVHVRDAVASRFRVDLVPEPVFLGATWPISPW